MKRILRGCLLASALGAVASPVAAERVKTVPGQSFDAEFDGFGKGRFISLLRLGGGPGKCAFEFHRADSKTPYVFPEPYANQWACQDVKAVAIADLNGDGRKDVLVLSTAITGIGPTGARPFNANTIYYNAGRGRFVTDAKVNEWASKFDTAPKLRLALPASPHVRHKVD